MKSPSVLKYLPRLQDFLFILFFVIVLMLGNRMLNLDGDLPRHIVTGKYIMQTGQLPKTEPFVYPYQNQEFVSQQWLAGVIFYLLYQSAGLSGIVIFSALLLSGTFTVLYTELVKKYDLRPSVLILVILGAATTSLSWITRPHLISMFLLSIWLVWAEKLRRGERIRIWYFPLLMLFWTNTHGEFIAGILVLFAYAAGSIVDYFLEERDLEEIKRTWLALLLSVVITVVNPGGFERWAGMLGFMNNPYMMSRMLETNPPNFQSSEVRILLVLIVLSILLLAFKRKRMAAGRGFLLAGFTAMSLMAFRNIHIYGIVAPFVLAETLIFLKDIPGINKFEENFKVLEANISRGYVFPVAAILLCLVFIYGSDAGHDVYAFDPSTFPTRAVEWSGANPQDGNMFNELNWGGYISFILWPNKSTFVDSVADTTGDLTMQYEKVITLQQGWEGVFEQYDIQWTIIPTQSLLANELERTGWHTLYRDKTAIILRAPAD